VDVYQSSAYLASCKEFPWHSLHCCPGTLSGWRKISVVLRNDQAEFLIINQRLLYLSTAHILGCTGYRLPPLQATRYNKSTHKCCVVTEISRQATGSPSPTRSRSPAVAQVLEADTSVALRAQTDGTVDSKINSASCTAGRMRTGVSGTAAEEWSSRWRSWTTRCRETRAAVVGGICLSFNVRLDYVFEQYNGSLVPLWTGLRYWVIQLLFWSCVVICTAYWVTQRFWCSILDWTALLSNTAVPVFHFGLDCVIE